MIEQQQQQHPFNGPLSGTIRVSQDQKGKTSLDLLEQETVTGSEDWNSWINWILNTYAKISDFGDDMDPESL